MNDFILHPKVLYSAYSQGYFPMPDPETGEIMWYRPDPRAIIPLDKFHTSRSLRRILRRQLFQITYDKAFVDVIEACSKRTETWINLEIKASYTKLHVVGAAHSVEVWQEGKLVGGVYGISFGGAFFAESMFSRVDNASKVALFHLVLHLREKGFELLECQFLTHHLQSLGAIEIEDEDYIVRLKKALAKKSHF